MSWGKQGQLFRNGSSERLAEKVRMRVCGWCACLGEQRKDSAEAQDRPGEQDRHQPGRNAEVGGRLIER